MAHEALTFLDDLIYCEWVLRCLCVAETQLWQESIDDIYSDPPTYPLRKAAFQNSRAFTRLQYRLDATRRARLRALECPPATPRHARPAARNPKSPNSLRRNWLRSVNPHPSPAPTPTPTRAPGTRPRTQRRATPPSLL